MSFYFPPDKELERRAAEKLRKLLMQNSFMERWEPVAMELKWVIRGRPEAEHHKKCLPDYCYNILELYRRTLFGVSAPMPEVLIVRNQERAAACKTIQEAKEIMTIDWEKLGSVFAMGERGLNFFNNEAEQKLQEDGFFDLSEKERERVFELMIGERSLTKKLNELQAQEPGKTIEEILEGWVAAIGNRAKAAVPEWHRKAGEWSPDAVTKFHTGVAKGSQGFLDKNGELTGEKKLKLIKTYELLLIVWPEIEGMLESKPRKTRSYLWDWIKPFSYAMWIEIQDLEQLNRLCNEMRLKLTRPGRPRKAK